MKDTKKLLELRNAAKQKKPTFLKQDANRLKRLSNHWRHPRGIHSKMRFGLRSYRKQPSVGFSSPKEVKGLTREGHEHIRINNIKELEGITTPVTIASKIGRKNKIEIIKKCQEKKIEILNIKDVNAYIKKSEDFMKKKKDEIKKRKEKREKKTKDKEKEKAKETEKEKAKEKTKEKKETKSVDEEDKKKQVEEEKRKILEKKD
jgi:large subunit ribosomal protein L32e